MSYLCQALSKMWNCEHRHKMLVVLNHKVLRKLILQHYGTIVFTKEEV